jgi:naphthalene 1,2-dioxygenase system ferredoxin subunit
MSEKWVSVCPRSSLSADEMLLEEAAGNEVVLTEIEGEVYAFDAICTHALGYLDQGDLVGYHVLCPLHEGRFDVRTGEVVAGEPEEPISVYQTRVEDGTVYVNVTDSPGTTGTTL